MNEVIVIAGNEHLALGLIRSLGAANYSTRLIALGKRTYNVAGRSKYVTAKICCREKADEILKALDSMKVPGQRILVIPANDRACRMLDQKLDLLSTDFFLPNMNNTCGSIAGFMDKNAQKQKAKDCGLMVANGDSYLTDKDQEMLILQSVSYPCFVKPLASASIKQCKLIFSKCDSPDELAKALDIARNHPCKEVLIEDYLEIEQEICAYGVAKEGTACIPACVLTEQVGKLAHAGVAAQGKVISSDVLGPVKDRLLHFIKDIGLNGLFCIDLIVSQGNIFFSEINLRAGGSGYGITLAGVNMPAMLADAVYNETPIEPREISKEVRFINERIEADLFVDGFISLQALRKSIAGDREHFIKDANDPAPWKLFIPATILKLFKAKTSRFRNR